MMVFYMCYSKNWFSVYHVTLPLKMKRLTFLFFINVITLIHKNKMHYTLWNVEHSLILGKCIVCHNISIHYSLMKTVILTWTLILVGLNFKSLSMEKAGKTTIKMSSIEDEDCVPCSFESPKSTELPPRLDFSIPKFVYLFPQPTRTLNMLMLN